MPHAPPARVGQFAFGGLEKEKAMDDGVETESKYLSIT